MDIFISLILILVALLVGAMSPGPSFMLIARISLGTSRRDRIAASIGMGTGGAIFSIFALLGLHAVLTSIPILYFVIKVVGGLYLVYLAVRIWKGATEPVTIANNNNCKRSMPKRSFLIGLITQMSNPKTAIVYASIFAALLPQHIPNALYFILPPLVFVVETGWYFIVSLVLSTSSPRTAYFRSKHLLDRVAAGVMAGLGLELVYRANE